MRETFSRCSSDSAKRHGESLPEPERRYPGNLRLRLPVSLHGRLVREAEREGVSLNQWIVTKLADGHRERP